MESDASLSFGGGDLAEFQREVRVIGADGRQLGIMNLSDAMKIADRERLDLIKITQTASPPVYRMVQQKPKSA